MRTAKAEPAILTPVAVLDLWWRPGALFDQLRNRWTWIPAYVQTAVLLGIGTAVSYSHVLYVNEQAFIQQGVSPAIINMVLTSTKVGFLLVPLVSPFVTPTLLAYLLLFLSAFLNIRVRFGKLFALVMWSFIPYTGLHYLIQALLTPTIQAQSVGMIDLSLGVVLPHTVSPVVRAFAGQLNPFYLWSLYLLAAGFAKLMRRPRRDGLICSGVVLAIRLLITLAVL